MKLSIIDNNISFINWRDNINNKLLFNLKYFI